jgi:hypothetical protein
MKKNCIYVFPILFLFILAACASTASPFPKPVVSLPAFTVIEPVQGIPFPRQQKINGEWAAMDALTSGTLVSFHNCLYLYGEESNTKYMLIWPPDFSAVEENGTIKILDDKKMVVASLGDKILMSGGEISMITMLDKSIQDQVPEKCAGPYWLIGYEFAKSDGMK